GSMWGQPASRVRIPLTPPILKNAGISGVFLFSYGLTALPGILYSFHFQSLDFFPQKYPAIGRILPFSCLKILLLFAARNPTRKCLNQRPSENPHICVFRRPLSLKRPPERKVRAVSGIKASEDYL
ncbi:MAG: hypothetical protein Q4D82_06800, partial [Neisseria sp.]|nr:hypothetical protein [Neisseria sp.]